MNDDRPDVPARIRSLLAGHEVESAAALALQWRATQPDNPDACFLVGVCRHLTGDVDAALEAFDDALSLMPTHRSAAGARAALLHQQGRVEESLHAYQALLAHSPDAALHVNLAVVMEDSALPDQALVHYESALALDGTDFRALLNHCGLLLRSARLDEAFRAAERLCAAHPDDAEAWVAMAHVCLTARDAVRTEAAAARALALDQGHPRALALQGLALAILGNIETANRTLQAAQAADPQALISLNEHLRAGEPLPDARLIYLVEGFERLRAADWSDYASLVRGHETAAREAAGEMPLREQQALVHRSFFLPIDAGQRAALSARIGQRIAQRTPPTLWLRAARPARDRLRIGYMSAHFRSHAAAFLMQPVIAGHDRTRVEVFGYGVAPRDTSPIASAIIGAFDRFQDLSAVTDDEAAWRIHRDACDVLVDQDGFIEGARPAILAYRPAAVQLLWLGYHGSLGGDLVDYYLADTLSSPVEHASRWREARLFMPHTAFPFPYHRLDLGAPPSRASLALPEQGPVLCAMHRMEKTDPELFDIWLQLLREREDAVLWLLQGPRGMEQRLRTRATSRGVEAQRLVFAPRVSVAEHLARLQVADCFLDTRWCNAHTTMLDAIAAGVPPVGWLDDDVYGRLGASILRAAGLHQRIAGTLAEYLDLARRTIAESGPTQVASARMHELRSHAPLYDVPAFVRTLEEGYRMIVERARSGHAPTDTHVPDTAYQHARSERGPNVSIPPARR